MRGDPFPLHSLLHYDVTKNKQSSGRVWQASVISRDDQYRLLVIELDETEEDFNLEGLSRSNTLHIPSQEVTPSHIISCGDVPGIFGNCTNKV
jgi:hypothetical protein